MTDETRKVVWVLGSGFSKGLGGPLLPELMDRGRHRRLNSLFLTGLDEKDQKAWATLHDQWKQLIEAFHSAEDSKSILGLPWRDAEEFMELLQLAANPTVPGDNEPERAQEILRNHVPTAHWKLEEYADRAKQATQLLAAVTHEFVAYSSAGTERWQPYSRWATQLVSGVDHVLTFNWDLVVETVYERAVKIKPSRSGLDRGGWLHKLHGSVDWVTTYNTELQTHRPFDAITSRGAARRTQLALGVPGPGKHLSCEGIFKPIWDSAKAALGQATEIVFVGYRFPPSDSYAKRTLLDALQANERKSLKVRIVLGPTRSDDVNRLEGMLRWTLLAKRRERHKGNGSNNSPLFFELVHEPMWAEDFLTVYNRHA